MKTMFLRFLLKKCNKNVTKKCTATVTAARAEYNYIRAIHGGRKCRLKLAALCLKYFFLPKQSGFSRQGRGSCPESASTSRVSPEALASRLAAFDVISFDIFDTLLFRPFASPDGLFRIAEKTLGIQDFWQLRTAAERRLQVEYSISDIYRELEQAIGAENGIFLQSEMQNELDLCYPNEYMTEVFARLPAGKHLIATSDMYLPSAFLRRLLDKNGFGRISEIYVSNEMNCGKRDGLFGLVKRKYSGAYRRFAHVGDNPDADFAAAKRAGFTPFHLPNVNIVGNPNRPRMSPLIGSAYAGIVNAKLHNGLKQYTANYEYGFVGLGLCMVGFAWFVNRKAAEFGLTKLIFTDDCAEAKEIFRLMFPDAHYTLLMQAQPSGKESLLVAFSSENDISRDVFGDYAHVLLSRTAGEDSDKVASYLKNLNTERFVALSKLSEANTEMNTGIMDFAAEWRKHFMKFPFMNEITPEDALASLSFMANRK
jgi:FMN phosphatase YigB (HAD superfamily)